MEEKDVFLLLLLLLFVLFLFAVVVFNDSKMMAGLSSLVREIFRQGSHYICYMGDVKSPNELELLPLLAWIAFRADSTQLLFTSLANKTTLSVVLLLRSASLIQGSVFTFCNRTK